MTILKNHQKIKTKDLFKFLRNIAYNRSLKGYWDVYIFCEDLGLIRYTWMDTKPVLTIMGWALLLKKDFNATTFMNDVVTKAVKAYSL